MHMGRLYRPAQDCSEVYGQRIVINEVLALSPADFEERIVAVVEPDKNGPYPDGLHTLSSFGDMTLVDGKREQFIWQAVVRSARNVWRGASKLEGPQISAVLRANHDVVEQV